MAWYNQVLSDEEKTWAIRLMAFTLICCFVIVYSLVFTNKELCDYHCKETGKATIGWTPYSCTCGKMGAHLDNATPINASDVLQGMPTPPG